MTTRKRILLLFAFLAVTLSAALAAAPAERPNILWLVSEDNNPLLGCYGDPLAHTPALDRLAKEGVLYERCFAQPVCAPSRFALITGLYAATAGPAHHMRAKGKIPSWLQGFPALLRDAGFYTSNNAKTDYNAPINLAQAWNESGQRAHWRKRMNPEQPFFSVFNHEVTHESCLFPERSLPLSRPPTDRAKVRIPPYQPDTPEIRDDWGRHYDYMSLLDDQVAAKLKDLAAAGLAENTIIFYFGDNGGVQPRSKRFLQRSGTHVPLIVYFPPKWRHLAPAAPGTRITDPVGFPDFAPTVLALAGVNVPAYMQGRAFAGLAKPAPHEFVFSTRDRMDQRYDMMRSVMDRRWLYIRNFRPDLPYVQAHEYSFKARGYQSWARVAAEGKLTAASARFWGTKPSEELYDLDADPDNMINLVQFPTLRPTLERMRRALQQHTVEINDNGFLPEGSSIEGYEASREAGAFPIARVFALATLASDRDPKNLPDLIAALDDPSEPLRWWAAQGCTMLGTKGAPAEAALLRCLADPSGAVQVAAAEALAALGRIDAALPALERSIADSNTPAFIMQAGNVLDRLGERARPALAAMKRAVASSPTATGGTYPPQHILQHAIAVLEGTTPSLVYP
jgi:arylsulfatase A-like enzyme